MITGDVKQKIDRVWDAFWSGGIINPLEVIEQITYLLFIRRLDDLQTRAERKARYTGKLIENPVFSPEQKSMRWHEFRNAAPAVMFWPTARGRGHTTGERPHYWGEATTLTSSYAWPLAGTVASRAGDTGVTQEKKRTPAM